MGVRLQGMEGTERREVTEAVATTSILDIATAISPLQQTSECAFIGYLSVPVLQPLAVDWTQEHQLPAQHSIADRFLHSGQSVS